jgi:hypothetical protein
MIRRRIHIQLGLDCMTGTRSTVFNCFMNDALSMLESHWWPCRVLVEPLIARIALAISSPSRGLPYARPTFENAVLHSSSPEQLVPVIFSVYAGDELAKLTGSI